MLNFRKAARRRWIACLHSLLNQGLSRLWIVGLCGMHILAIFISFLENSGIVSVLFTMRCFWHWEWNSSQLALFNLHRGRSSSWGCKLSSTIGKWSLPHAINIRLQISSVNYGMWWPLQLSKVQLNAHMSDLKQPEICGRSQYTMANGGLTVIYNNSFQLHQNYS